MLRYTFRRLVRAPGFSVAAIATLALGIGANTTIFTMVSGSRVDSRRVAGRVRSGTARESCRSDDSATVRLASLAVLARKFGDVLGCPADMEPEGHELARMIDFPEQSGVPIRHDWSNSCPVSWTRVGGMSLTDSPANSDTAENRIRHRTSELND
jgi:hypothetical protein